MKILIFLISIFNSNSLVNDFKFISDKKCGSDKDCPLYFKCEEIEKGCEEVIICSFSPQCSEADSDTCPSYEQCEEITECKPVKEKVCTYTPKECSKDSDCFENFYCYKSTYCPPIGCEEIGCLCPSEENEEILIYCPCEEIISHCEEIKKEECYEVGICTIKEINCEKDQDCPQGWECVDFSDLYCYCEPCECGEKFSNSSKNDEVFEFDYYCSCPPCKCDETKKRCLIKDWQEIGYYGEAPLYKGSVTDVNSTTEYGTSKNETDTKKESSGSCSIGNSSISSNSYIILILFLFTILLKRKVIKNNIPY